MKTMLIFQNKQIPVYLMETTNKKALDKLTHILNHKWLTGKQALKRCLASLISIEVIGAEATLHSLFEHETLTISLY